MHSPGYNARQSSSRLLIALCWLLLAAPGWLRADETYRKAPAPIPQILDTPAPPIMSLSPHRDRMLLLQRARYSSLADLAEPWKGLAGLRVNTQNSGPQITHHAVSLILKSIPDGRERKVPIAPNARVSLPVWSPDGT
ncbi:MAG: hypothetical protein HY300_01795, partial [Verrucomicrobia bacterium]|nr:hypothetical protein [Verrucomicrobiota bacterium]